MTQEAFAKKLGVSRATLNRLENASQNINDSDTRSNCHGVKVRCRGFF